VTGTGLSSEKSSLGQPEGATTSVAVPFRPDEVLFKQKNAPIRYEEDDVYWADEKLPPNVKLPDSDLLKALHVYASDFYANATDKNKRDWRSLDETALLALGILLEEAAAEALGEAGDVVFTEAEDEDEEKGPRVWNGSTWVRSVLSHANRKQNE
jgi:hypothetical protein